MNKIEAAIQCVQDRYCARSSDNIELDDNPATAPVDSGIWVQVWIFVHNEDIDKEMNAST